MIEITEKRMIGPVIRLHPNDNVVVARQDVAIGTVVEGESFTSHGDELLRSVRQLAQRHARTGQWRSGDYFDVLQSIRLGRGRRRRGRKGADGSGHKDRSGLGTTGRQAAADASKGI